MMRVPNQFRIRDGAFASTEADGNNGAFMPTLRHKQLVRVIASDGAGWEHVSVSRSDRTPTWDEMCQVKDLFWDETDTVIQYHPAKTDYVNNHQFCLHMWRPTEVLIPVPPSILVGVKGLRLK